MSVPLCADAQESAELGELGERGGCSRKLGQQLLAEGARASALSSTVSRWSPFGYSERQSVQPHARPRLLAGMCAGEAGALGANVCVVQASGQTRNYQHAKIGELVRDLWPDEPYRDSLCRTLRFLSDGTKQDFFLRQTRRGILVRADFATALVEPDRAIFLSTRAPAFESFREELLEHVKVAFAGGCPQEYVFSSVVVEAIVCATVTMHTLRLQVLKPVAENILGSIRLQSPNSILQLYPLKCAIASFVEQVRPLAQGLNAVLQDPEGLGGGATGRQLRTQSETSIGGDVLPAGLEDCLHKWAHSAEEVMADALETNIAIEDTMRFLEASMSCTRNRLLVFELGTMIATVAMGTGALISGIFGMNLTSGMETEPGRFDQAVMLIVVLAILITVGSVAFISWSQHHYQNHTARFGNNRFFRSIADDDYVLSLCSRPDSSLPPTVELQKVLRELRQPALPVSEPHVSPIRRPPSGACRGQGLELSPAIHDHHAA